MRAVSGALAPRASKPRAKPVEKLFAAELESGTVPSIRSIKTRAHVGTPKAMEIRDQLAAMLEALPEAA